MTHERGVQFDVIRRRNRMLTSLLAALLIAAFSLVVAPQADASMLIGHNLRKVSLKVNKKGDVGLVTYQFRSGGKWKWRRTLAWGAVDWPKGGKKFKLDRTGGWKTKGRYGRWQTFRNACKRYKGARIPYAKAKCSVKYRGKVHHWAVQGWQRVKPNYGGKKGLVDWRLSHWTTKEIPRIDVWADWTEVRKCHRAKYHCEHIYGTYTFQGTPIVGDEFTRLGYVTDGQARNLSLESYNPDYPKTKGWVRVNMFLAQRPSGQFCFIFGPKDKHSGLKLANWQVRNLGWTGRSSKEVYMMASAGPGVLPDVVKKFRGVGRGTYDPAVDAVHNERRRKLAPPGDAKNCQTD